MTEPEDEMLAVAAAEGTFHTKKYAGVTAEPEPDPIVGLQVAERQILETWRHFSGVVEDRAVNGREDLPAVLRLEQQHVGIAKAEPSEAAKIVRPAERSLKVERHFAAWIGVRRRDEGMECENATVVQHREVLLEVRFHTPKRVATAVEVVELLKRDGVSASPARITARLSVVQIRKELVTEEIGLNSQSRRRLFIEERVDSPAVAHRAHMRSEVVDTRADAEPSLGSNG